MMREWIDFLVSYPTWIKVIIAVSIAVNAVLLLVFRPEKKETARASSSGPTKCTGKVTDARTFSYVRGAKVSLNYEGVNAVKYTDSEGFYVFEIDSTGLPISARIRVEADNYSAVERNIQISKAIQSEDIQLQPIAPTPTHGPTPEPDKSTKGSASEKKAPQAELEENSSQESNEAVKRIVTGCYRRAVFTRTHAQMSHEAMFKSISTCRETVQSNLILIKSPDHRQLAANVLAELYSIERQQPPNNNLSNVSFEKIDESKLKIIHGLNDLAKSINLEFTLPNHLTEEIFFSLDEANKAPSLSH